MKVAEKRRPVRAAITAVGHYVPPEIRDNTYFTERLATSDEWIVSRTGIRQRRVLTAGGTSDLAAPAARQCLAARGIHAEDVDCIIVATITPDHVFPPTAAIVQQKLGASNAWRFDLSAACSGFPYALNTSCALVTSGAVSRRIANWFSKPQSPLWSTPCRSSCFAMTLRKRASRGLCRIRPICGSLKRWGDDLAFLIARARSA